MLQDLSSNIRADSRCDESTGEGSGTNTTVASSPGVEASLSTQTYPVASEFPACSSFTKRHAYHNLQPMSAYDNPDISPTRYKSLPLERPAADASSPPPLSSSPPIFEPPPLPCSLAINRFPSPPPDYQLTAAASAAAEAMHPPCPPHALGANATAATSPSTFPSPGSAFTELQPRAVSNARMVATSRQFVTPLTAAAQAPSQMVMAGCKSAFHEPVPFNASTNVPISAFITSTACATNCRVTNRTDIARLEPGLSSNSSSSSSPLPNNGVALPCCCICGQMHLPNAAHRYNYPQPVVDDLCCTLCRLPLVDPLDTKCGHTFCTPCLNNHLAVQALCPVDRQIINYLECQQASNIVKRLLDKLPVSCPNNRYCDVVLHRGGLEDHLRNWCSGAILPCDNSSRGCSFLAPRLAHRLHASRCPFLPNGFGPTGGDCLMVCTTSAGLQPTNSSRLALSQGGQWVMVSSSKAATRNSDRGISHHTQEKRTDVQRSDDTFLDGDAAVIESGNPTSVIIHRLRGCADLGFTFVGGADTPLPCILIQEIYLNGAVAVDGRLRPGDQVLEVNGQLVTLVSHAEARHCLTAPSAQVQLTVFRETVTPNVQQQAPLVGCGQAVESLTDYEEEIFDVKLCKRQGKVLGIKLVGKKVVQQKVLDYMPGSGVAKSLSSSFSYSCTLLPAHAEHEHLPGLYVLELVSGCEADLDGRLKKDDQILEINSVDLSEGTPEQGANIINSSDFVIFKVSRRNRSDTPDILRTTDSSEERQPSVTTPSAGNRRSAFSCNSVSSSSDSPVAAITNTSSSVITSTTSSSSASSVSATALSSNSSEPLLTRLSVTSQCSGKSSDGNTLPYNVSNEQRLDLSMTKVASSTETGTIGTSAISSGSKTEYPVCQEQVVMVTKAPDAPLGVSVAGGRQSQRGDTPIYVTNISGDCLLGRNKLVKRGDVLLEVNGIGLVGLTHNEAVDVLRRASHLKSQVQLRLIAAPESTEETANFMPSWTYWLQLPPICQLARIVRLVRSGNAGTFEPLGFTIVGGLRRSSDPRQNKGNSDQALATADREKKLGYSRLCSCPIVIKSIVPGLLAHRDARLKCGDLILAVNNISMLNVPHAVAVRLLKQLRSEVTLQIISWPGTIV